MEKEKGKPRYWLYAPGEGASEWERCQREGIMCLGWDDIGDFSRYHSEAELTKTLKSTYNKTGSMKNDKCAIWDFANKMKIGDIVFAKKGLSKIIGRGIVESDYAYDAAVESYKSYRKVKWTDVVDLDHPGNAVVKTLTDITKYKEYVKKLNAMFVGKVEQAHEPYSEEQFLDEVYISKERLASLKALLERKKNVILQGAPGVGKTFAARRLAYLMMGCKDQSRVEFVQFHQNYSYEDFIMGYKPDGEGFKLRCGTFYNFCRKAQADSEHEYFFIIDEINRGNLSKIFGELLMLIENNYRGEQHAVRLAYSDETFFVPENLYIIGMMNTADRSLAMIDYALRRRFSFFTMKPGFDSEGFRKYQESLNSKQMDKAIDAIRSINKTIREDGSLGEGFCIGHSYFCGQKEFDGQWLNNVIDFDIEPLLKEYWFDNPTRCAEQIKLLKQTLGDD